MFRMVLEGNFSFSSDSLLRMMQAKKAVSALGKVARKFCGRREHGIRQWIEANAEKAEVSGDSAFKQENIEGWAKIKALVMNAKPVGNVALQRAVEANVCSARVTGEAKGDHAWHAICHQLWYKCLTCWPTAGKGVCVACAANCHFDHKLEMEQERRAGCSCSTLPALVSCQCKGN
jgi:hypothetical protein